MEICGNPGQPITIVLCLHQSSVCIKKKLGVWRAQKCNPLVGGKTTLTCGGLQTAPSHVSQYSAENWNLRKSWSTFRDGTVPYIFHISIRVASFWYHHCFGANAVPRKFLSPTLFCHPWNGVVCGPTLVTTVSAPTKAIHFWPLHTRSFLLMKPLLWCKRGIMWICRPEILHISIPDPILPPMKWGSFRTRTGKYCFCTLSVQYILELSIPVAFFWYNHSFGAKRYHGDWKARNFACFHSLPYPATHETV